MQGLNAGDYPELPKTRDIFGANRLDVLDPGPGVLGSSWTAGGQILVDTSKLYSWPKGQPSKFNDPGAFLTGV